MFEDELRRAISSGSRDDLEIRQTHSRHFGIKDNNASLIPYQIVRSTDTAMNNNGNNVDMDLEMANLAENQLMYNYMADKVSGHYTKIRDMLQNLK
ncbi:Flagellar basal body rod protein FlgB [compost metagenome]